MHLRTLGGLELIGPPGKRPLNRPKPLLLLAYLAVEGPKDRHHLAELFWPEANRPLDSLRVALSQLRSAAPGVLTEPGSYAASAGANAATFVGAGGGAGRGAGASVGTAVDCDALQLLGALAEADHKRIRQLYTGEFLAGFYLRQMSAELEEWVLATRDHLATSVQLACVVEAERLAAASAFAEAGRLAAGALDLVSETDHELLPRLYRLLRAADHPFSSDIVQRAAAYGATLNLSLDAARAELTAASSRAVAHNLPSRVAPFVGRDTEQVTLVNLLATGSRLVTVTGIGGVGKSRLALQAATAALRDGLFPDGVFLAELAPVVDHRHVLDTVAAVIDPDGSGPPDRLAKVIGGRKVLVLLDNFEHVIEAGPALTVLLEACPALSVLATSRVPLNLYGEQLFKLREFDLPAASTSAEEALTLDAVRLFQTAARRARHSFTVDATNHQEVLEICRGVHGLPLGIELAAAWAGELPPTELAENLLRHSEGLLNGPRDAVPRQRSLRATMDHAWSQLSDHETRGLTRLAAFSGGFTHDAASHVAGASLATLNSLSSRSLLNISADGRYDAHPLVADYARERLDADAAERSAALSAHAAYFVDLTERAEEGLKGGDQAGWLRRLDAELPNLRAAIDWLLAQAAAGSIDDARDALRISGALWQYWLRRGLLVEGRGLADAALAAAPDDGLPLERAKALAGAGVLSSRQGDEKASEAYNRAALELRRREGDRLGEARALYNLAASAGHNRDIDRAEEYLTAAIDIFREEGDEWSLAYALFNLSNVARHRGDEQAASNHLQERLRLQAAIDDEAGMAETHVGLGHISLTSGALDAAEESFEAGLAIARRLADFYEEAAALEGLALVAYERGEEARSKALFGEAVGIRSEHELGPSTAYDKLAELHRPDAFVP